jgi:alpha-beta hydrolase superfamily lysophospholipase
VREHARNTTLGPSGVPALLAHPDDWATPAPFCLWMHGRSVNKELDPGRYSRWLRAGIGVVAIDLPGHGERADPPRHHPEQTVEVITEALGEIDEVLEALRGPGLAGSFDLEHAAIGGMSMGGMITLRRLCDPHEFRCAVVEGTTGDLCGLYFPRGDDAHEPWPVRHDETLVIPVDASRHLDTLEPIPLLVMHSEADEMVPWRVQERFLTRLREHFGARGASPDAVEVHTWPETGAPAEHLGFGRFSNEAKNLQTDFLARHLLGGAE